MKKEGYQDALQQMDSTVSGWYIANIFFGGLLGMIVVDPASGGMYSFPDSIKGSLKSGIAKEGDGQAPTVASSKE